MTCRHKVEQTRTGPMKRTRGRWEPTTETYFVCAALSKGRKEPLELKEVADPRCAKCILRQPKEN